MISPPSNLHSARTSDSRRIVFLNRYFYPDHSATSEILSDLAFGLSSRGFPITVITSRLGYDHAERSVAAREVLHGVDVWRVWTSRWGRHRLIGRSLDYATFYLAAGWRLWRLARPGDIIVAKTDPPLLSVIAALIARLRRAALINWQQDIFPEIAEVLGIGGTIGQKVLTFFRGSRNWSLRTAAMTVVPGERMSKVLGGIGLAPETIRVIPNWSDGKRITPIDPSQNSFRKKWGLEDCFVVGYAGNLGRAHEIETVLGAMKALNHRALSGDGIARLIKFLFLGGGALRPRLEEEAGKCGLTNVQFHPYQPRQQLAEVLSAADVHLVILNPAVEGLLVPSKIYAAAAAGRPAIFIGDARGEIARMLDVSGFGFTVAPGDPSNLELGILRLARSPELCRLLGTRARAAFEQSWDQTIMVTRWEKLFQELAETRAGDRVTK